MIFLMLKSMMKNLFKRRVMKSEYDIIYRWYEEKRDECEQLRKRLEQESARQNCVIIILEPAHA